MDRRGENFQNRLPRKGPLRELSNAPVVGIARHLLPMGSEGDLARFQPPRFHDGTRSRAQLRCGPPPTPPSFTLSGRLQTRAGWSAFCLSTERLGASRRETQTEAPAT